MTFSETAKLPPTPGPAAFVGAASPLWFWFGAAAAGGLTYWWLTRFARPVNLEALLAPAAAAVPTPDAVEALAEAFTPPIPEPTAPVGGESAPFGPAAADAEVEAAPAEPAIEDIGPAPKSKKSAAAPPTMN